MNRKQIIQQKYAIEHEITEEEYTKAKETKPDEFKLYYITRIESTRISAFSEYKDERKYYRLEFISDEDTNMQILFDILQKEKKINRNTDTIKGIAIYFLALSIIGIVFSLLNSSLHLF